MTTFQPRERRAFRGATGMMVLGLGILWGMEGMAYYIVKAFFAALCIHAFGTANLGALLAVKGAAGLQALALPGGVTGDSSSNIIDLTP